MFKNKKLAVVVLCMAALLVACAGQFPATPKGTYAQSLSMFNDIVEAYYSLLLSQNEETKVKWKEDVNPIIHMTGAALDMWGRAVGTVDEEPNHMMYLKMWQDLLPVLFKIGVLKVEE